MDALLTRIPENKLRPRLEPTRRAAELLGNPQHAYRVIHVTGTNGKTSTTRFIERILREFGLHTGRFTSPHLVKLNERMSLNGEPVSDQQLAEVWADTAPLLEIVDAELEAAGDTKLTFFEALALLGFAVFADAPVDVLVLEVGMGGEWDSTNVADGDVAVFTPISIDHAERLGSTFAEIATTKSGIIKPGALVLSSEQPAEAAAVLQAKAEAIAEGYFKYGADFEVTNLRLEAAGQRFDVRTLAGEYRDLFLPLHGEYQAENAALAICAVEAFLGGGTQRLLDDVIRVALADASSPGRLQVISRKPLVILDAAHNPGGAATLARALKRDFDSPTTTAVLSVLAEKDARGLLEALKPALDHVIVTQSTSPRAIAVEELFELAVEIFGAANVSQEVSVYRALELAKTRAGTTGAVVVSGSISLVGDVLKQIQLDDSDYNDADDADDEDDAPDFVATEYEIEDEDGED
jgi:dihydrofolate synthase/folylpolyglutamate synthase